jgi:hypothetical protein
MQSQDWLLIHNGQGQRVASCQDIFAAALLMSLYGKGAQVRKDDSEVGLLWHEGFENQLASAGIQFATTTISARAKLLIAT